MNFALSDEQEFLREAAHGALSRFKTVEAAREALDKGLGELPDLWPTAVEAGWPGLLISEEHGGAGLGVFDAMLVAEELGRALAPVPFLGVVPATAILGTPICAPVATCTGATVEIPSLVVCVSQSSLGCDSAQGFLYGRPVPPEEFSAWLLSEAGVHGRATTPPVTPPQPTL